MIQDCTLFTPLKVPTLLKLSMMTFGEDPATWPTGILQEFASIRDHNQIFDQNCKGGA